MPANYYEEINRQFQRRVTVEAQLSTGDPTHVNKTLYADGSLQAIVSKPNQLYDQNPRMSFGWNTLEPQRVNTTGQFVIYDYDTVGQFGWWGDALADANGDFGEPQIIKLSHSEDLNVYQFSIFFDYWANEYATDFNLSFYDSANVLIKSFDVTDNDAVQYLLDEPISGIRGVTLAINKWSKGLRRAKVSELSGGVILMFGEDEVTAYDIIENTNVLEDEISISQCGITINNFDQKFNPIAPQGFENRLQDKQIFTVHFKIGNSGIIIPSCFMHLWEWETVGNETTFKCRSVFEFTEGEYIAKNHNTVAAYDLVEEILTDMNISDFSISPDLMTVTVNRYCPTQSLRAALQQLLNACCAYVYVNKSGVVVVDMIKNIFTNTNLTLGFDTILPDDSIYYPPIKQEKLIDGVTSSVYTYSLDAAGVVDLVKDLAITFEPNETLYVEYGSVATSVVATASTGTITAVEYFADRCKITASGDLVITIRGNKLIQNVVKRTIYADTYYTTPVKNVITLDNPFVALVSQSTLMSNAYIDLSKYRVETEINDRGRPDIELNDMVRNQNKFGFLNGFVVEQRFKWDKFLSGYYRINNKRAIE